MSAENKRIVQGWFDALGSRDGAAFDDVCTADYAHHDASLSVQDADLETFKQMIGVGLVGAFPDVSATVDDMVAEGDRVMVRWRFQGVHDGELPGHPPVPATGRSVSVNAMSIHRVAGGRVAETWVMFDALGLMQQLGAVPS